jgi:hypothetical protein
MDPAAVDRESEASRHGAREFMSRDIDRELSTTILGGAGAKGQK